MCSSFCTHKRPNILAATSQLSRFLENPGKRHWVAVKIVLRFLKGSKDLELYYSKDSIGSTLCEPVDTDCFVDVDNGMLTTGYSFHLHKTGVECSWNSKKKPAAAISTIEVPYQAMVALVQKSF